MVSLFEAPIQREWKICTLYVVFVLSISGVAGEENREGTLRLGCTVVHRVPLNPQYNFDPDISLLSSNFNQMHSSTHYSGVHRESLDCTKMYECSALAVYS
jgi:hypothetical protein